MDVKENALRIIRFNRPERVMTWLHDWSLAYHGCNHEGCDGLGGDGHPVGSRWTDIWGTGWHKELDGVMGLPEVMPLANPEALRSYRWPDPNDERFIAKAYSMAKEFPGGNRLLGGSHRDTLWEKAYMLVGMQDLMVYFYTEPGFVREVLHRIMDFQMGIAAHYVKLGIEIAHLGDDLGTQNGPLLGPQIVSEFLEPEYRRLTDFYRQRGTLLDFHSCGNVASVVGMFMDLGIKILNPVQASANNLDQLRQATQGRMALSGGVSSKTVYEGPVQAIVAEVRSRLWQLGREGGYFCAPDQGLPYPKAHTDALNEAVDRYGLYPLSPPD